MNKMTDLTDEALVGLIQEGSAQAFEIIYKKYWYLMYHVAYQNIGSHEESEQLVQDVFEGIWTRRAELNVRAIKVYLIVAVKNKSLNYIKSQITMRKYQEYLIFQEIQQSYQTESIVYFNDLIEALESAMRALPEKTAEVFKLSRFENKSNRDIAVELNLSEKAVEYHITRSLKFLKSELQRFHTPN